MIRGSLARVNVEDAETRPRSADRRSRAQQPDGGPHQPDRFRRATPIPIRHVIYIMKENRTYDQIFGDIKEANGDPSLVMYGEDITPNQHKLARQFGVLDNFYDSGEVSGDGHPWSLAAITTDYNEKVWPIAYRGEEREYDSEGTVGSIASARRRHSRRQRAGHRIPVRQPRSPQADLSPLRRVHRNPLVRGSGAELHSGGDRRSEGTVRRNATRRDIMPGEELPAELGGGKSPYQYEIPLMAYNSPTKADLRNHFDPKYPDFKVEYPDQFRADEFLREFAEFVAARKTGKGEQLPSFAWFGCPTTTPQEPSPVLPRRRRASPTTILAVGRVVEAVSHSPYWDDTAIFVIEDDAQNGADHVDAHRSIALVVSKYSPRAPQPFVDHNFYTTVNMIHTMETLLGLPPMNNNDAYAAVMAPLFTGPGDQPAFMADYRNRDNQLIYQANAEECAGSEGIVIAEFLRCRRSRHRSAECDLVARCHG